MLRDDTIEPEPPEPARTAHGAVARDEPPLDPAIERIRARVARLIALGIGTLLLGVLAVGIVAFYKTGAGPSTPVARGAAGGDMVLPTVPGSVLEDAQLAQDGLLLRFAMPDGDTQLVVLDPASGAPRLRVTLSDRPARAD